MKKCYEDCGNCEIIISKTVPICNHIMGVKCYIPSDQIKCEYEKIYKYENCNHSIIVSCDTYVKHPENIPPCSQKVEIAFPCKHSKQVICMKQIQELNIGCMEYCGNVLKCGHMCRQKCRDCKSLVLFCVYECMSVCVCVCVF